MLLQGNKNKFSNICNCDVGHKSDSGLFTDDNEYPCDDWKWNKFAFSDTAIKESIE